MSAEVVQVPEGECEMYTLTGLPRIGDKTSMHADTGVRTMGLWVLELVTEE